MTDCAFENENASAWGTGPFLLQAQVRAERAECRRPSRDPWTVWCESKESASRQGGRKMEGVYHGHEGCDREERFKLRMESLTQFNVRRVRRQIATSTFLTAACNRGGSRVGALVSSEAGKLEDSQTILSERKEPIHRLRMNAAAFPHADARLQCLDASQGAGCWSGLHPAPLFPEHAGDQAVRQILGGSSIHYVLRVAVYSTRHSVHQARRRLRTQRNAALENSRSTGWPCRKHPYRPDRVSPSRGHTSVGFHLRSFQIASTLRLGVSASVLVSYTAILFLRFEARCPVVTQNFTVRPAGPLCTVGRDHLQ